MPQFTGAISIKDHAGVDVSFVPELLSSAETVLVDRRKAVRDQQPTITLSFSRPSQARKTFKVKHSFAIPIVETIGGTELVTDIARANVEYILPLKSNESVRRTLNAWVTWLQVDPLVQPAVANLDPLY